MTLSRSTAPRSRRTLRARLLRPIMRHVFRERGEICKRCGIPVAWGCPSWWTAPDALWLAVECSEAGIRCVRCFTIDCHERGLRIWWSAVPCHQTLKDQELDLPMKLTPLMTVALTMAQRQPLRRVHDDQPGKPAWPANPCTLHALERHGLVTRTERSGRPRPDGTANRIEEWTITGHGRLVLNPPPKVVKERPVFLARPTRNSGDYTNHPGRAIDRAEVVDVDVLDERWAAGASGRHASAQDRREQARRLAKQTRAA